MVITEEISKDDIKKFDVAEIDTEAYSTRVYFYISAADKEFCKNFYKKYVGNDFIRSARGIELALGVYKDTGDISDFTFCVIELDDCGCDARYEYVDISVDDHYETIMDILDKCGADDKLVELVKGAMHEKCV